MNTLTSIIRIATLSGLGISAMLLLFGQETHEDLTLWLINVIFDKAVAIVAAFVFVHYYKQWSKTDPWISAFDRWSNPGKDTDLDTSNPV